MKKSMMIMAVICLAAYGAFGADASVSVDLASAYVFRGVTLNDGPVLQPGVEVRGLPIDLGVWGNVDLDDYNGALADGEFSEIDIYASYTLPTEAVEVSVGYTEYTYPNARAEADREVSLSAGLDLPLAPSATVYYGFDGGIDKQVFAELSLGHKLEVGENLAIELGASAAYLDPDEGESGIPYYTVSAGAGYKCISAGVTYVGQIDDDVLPDGEFAYDVEVMGSLGVTWDF